MNIKLCLIIKEDNVKLAHSGSNSDEHQISPCNIHAYSTPEEMRIRICSPKLNFLDIS